MSTPPDTLAVGTLALAVFDFWCKGTLGLTATQNGHRRLTGFYAQQLADMGLTGHPKIRDRALARATTLVREGTTLVQAEAAAAYAATLPCDCEPA